MPSVRWKDHFALGALCNYSRWNKKAISSPMLLGCSTDAAHVYQEIKRSHKLPWRSVGVSCSSRACVSELCHRRSTNRRLVVRTCNCISANQSTACTPLDPRPESNQLRLACRCILPESTRPYFKLRFITRYVPVLRPVSISSTRHMRCPPPITYSTHLPDCRSSKASRPQLAHTSPRLPIASRPQRREPSLYCCTH